MLVTLRDMIPPRPEIEVLAVQECSNEIVLRAERLERQGRRAREFAEANCRRDASVARVRELLRGLSVRCDFPLPAGDAAVGAGGKPADRAACAIGQSETPIGVGGVSGSAR